MADELEGSFFHTAIRSKAYVPFFTQASDGVRIGQWDLSKTRMAETPFYVPPLPEQHAIARFLDHIDGRINRLIRARRKLIALLNEQKQAVIHRAVTRGLDPDVELRPSGVEWLGDIPAHWEVLPLKYVATVQTGITLGKNYGASKLKEFPYLRVANVQDGFLDLSSIKTINLPPQEASGSMLQVGDVLMTEGGDIDKLGRGYIWQGEIQACLHQNHIFAVRADQRRLLPGYLVALMTSKYGRDYFQLTAKQTTNLASTNTTTLRAFSMPLPNVDEQQAILQSVRESTGKFDVTTRRTLDEIDLIREYRTRLIADVVTGKLDIRAAAAALPEELAGGDDAFDLDEADEELELMPDEETEDSAA